MSHARWVTKSWRHLARRLLIEPWAVGLDEEERRHARLLASVLITLVPLGLLLAALPAWAVSYLLVRAGWFRTSITLATVAGICDVIAACWVDREAFDAVYLLFPVLVASAVLAWRGALTLLVLVVGVLLLASFAGAAFDPVEMLTGPAAFLLLAGGCAVLLARHRDAVERTRRRVLARSEARYRCLFESVFVGLGRVEDGVLVEVNRGFENLAGRPREELVGTALLDLCSPTSRQALAEALERPGSTGPIEAELATAGGSWRDVEILVRRAGDAGGRGEFVALRDISERRRAARSSERAHKLESVGLLAGGVAHDFNNLLTAILGEASTTSLDLPEGTATRASLERIAATAERAADLTRQLLAYSGKGAARLEVLDLNRLIEENRRLFEKALPRPEWLQLDLAPELPAVEADRGMIQQVVMNLALNAADAVREHSGRVTIRTRRRRILESSWDGGFAAGATLPGGEYVRLAVEDTGVGMDRETIERMFDPFFTRKEEGHGLGLSAALGIVRSHRGAMRVRSAPGAGTSIEVFLPVARPARRASAPPMRSGAQLTCTVLVVDDEPSVRSAIASMLEASGARALTAKDGPEALSIYSERGEQIDVVILDVHMPGMSGLQTFRALRDFDPSVRVVFSSGMTESAEIRELVRTGQARFLAKPYGRERIVASVGEMLAAARPAGRRPSDQRYQ